MITNFFIPELNNHDVQELWFQQDGATCHTARATIDLLKDTFGDRLISRFGPVNWPPRSNTARLFSVGVNEDDIEELIMGHEDELTIEELQEILNEEHQETQPNVSPSEQEEDKRGPMPTSAIKDLLKKWETLRAMVLEWYPNQADVSRVGDLYNDNAINYFWKILKKREKQSTLDMFFNAP
ncbi:uncharacterized protein TNCV_4896231 [Trichonephila clavipes]|uniref:Transposase n=1 Tax=Trichonephila clavipes TaxID=2585209 RepID=A0A8X7BAR5_TRICX|nr:uncharacterized protein TNCV_4896231 [Trichonephila clavipes]